MRSVLLLSVEDEIDVSATLACGADALVLQLGPDHARARARARAFVARARAVAARPLLFVRIAPATGEEIDADLAALISAAPDGVFLEQAEGAASVQHLCAKLAVWEAEAGLPDGVTRIVALAAQTPAAIFALGGYKGASPRLAGLAFDGEGLRDVMGSAALARALLALGAAAAGVAAIDAPYAGDDATGLAAACRVARRDGFSGLFAVSAAQVAVINGGFRDPPPS